MNQSMELKVKAFQDIPVNPDRPIVLDPSGKYHIPPGYMPITTEIQWMESFGVDDSPCWVQGKRLCDWAREWLKAWNKLDKVAHILIDPLLRLQDIFDEIPSQWSEEQRLEIALKLNTCPEDNPVAHLLTYITGQSIWLEEPSIENLAAWLALDIPPEWQALEKLWQNQLSTHELGSYYQTADKWELLRAWLGMTATPPKDLPPYPLPIPENIREEFDRYWQEVLYKTQGRALSSLIPAQVAGFERIARVASQVFQNRPAWLDKLLLRKIIPYLTLEDKEGLNQIIPPEVPPLLAPDARAEDALKWVTESYFPYRRWETLRDNLPPGERKSDRAAESFINWIERCGEDLPDAKNIFSLGSKDKPILWIVIEGLQWWDHQDLLSLLAQNRRLALENNLKPHFLLSPMEIEEWPIYQEADTDSLCRDLRAGIQILYRHDMGIFAESRRSAEGSQQRYKLKHCLEGIARDIEFYAAEYIHPEKLRVMITGYPSQRDNDEYCPEEILFSTSIWCQFLPRQPVLVSCRGEGEANKLGKLEITIDNPNTLPLIDLYLCIDELAHFKTGVYLETIVPENTKVTLTLDIPKLPNLPHDNENDILKLNGELTFNFPESELIKAKLTEDSAVRIKQLFASNLDISDFL